MPNIVIIGNGFDLAHNYQTSYNSFIQKLFEESMQTQKHSELFSFQDARAVDIIEKINIVNLIKYGKKVLKTENGFFRKIIREIQNKKWCDIEKEYFKELNSTKDVERLNKEFEVIKNKLEVYLKENVVHENKINSYVNFFNELNKDNTTLLNFNYTKTLQELYGNETSGCEIINIHGELDNQANPIIFGYASNFNENKELLKKNNSEYLKNIKSYNYKRTGFNERVETILDTQFNEDINIYLMGHSCSLSDKNILESLFNNEQTKTIDILYHNDYNSYFNVLVNIHRIMDSDKNYKTIVNFDSSLRMPQHDDSTEFDQKFISESNIKTKQYHNKYREHRHITDLVR